MSDARWYAVWPNPRSRSRALQSWKSGHFQLLSPPPFIMWADNWPRILKLGLSIYIITTYQILMTTELPFSSSSAHVCQRCLVVLFCSLAVLDPRVGHTMDVLSPFITVLCHSDWLFHGESCPRIDVVHPGRVWSSSPACTCLPGLIARTASGWPHHWRTFSIYLCHSDWLFHVLMLVVDLVNTSPSAPSCSTSYCLAESYR